MAPITISAADLAKSAHQYKKELLVMPVRSIQEALQHFTPMAGVRGRVTLGELAGNIEMGPYSATRKSTDGVTITPRTLEVFLGSALEDFDPNEVHNSVYGSLIAQGEALKITDIILGILSLLSRKLGKGLHMSLWNARRNDGGTRTNELFNGFDTITADEITAGNIATGKKNLFEFSETIDATNAVDALKAFYYAASDELQGQQVKLYMPFDVYRAYLEDYKLTTGLTPYNTEYKKTFLEGSDNLCEFVPMVSKKGSSYLHLTPKANMVYGYGHGLADENIAVEKHHPFLLTFVATMFFGTQMRSISPEVLQVGKLFTAQAAEPGQDAEGGE